MKKLKYLLVLCLFAIISTGCVKFNANMNIKKDKSMDFSIIYALDKTYFNGENSLKEEQFKEVEKEGFTITKYSEGNFEGFKLVKKVNNIDEVSSEDDAEYNLSGLMNNNTENKYIFKVVKGEKSNIYYAKFKFDSNDSGLNMDDNTSSEEFDDEIMPDEAKDASNSLDNMDFSGMMQGLDLSFNVTLPYSAISSNATTKDSDNKNLSWKLTTEKSEYIEFSFELPNNVGGVDMKVVYIGIGVLAIIIIVLLILILNKKNKNKIPVVKDNQIKVENVKEENVTPIESTLKNTQSKIDESN